MSSCCYKNIFIHHMFGGIGDFIMGTSGINMIKSVFPDVKITVLAPFPATDIIKNNPVVDNVMTLNYKSGSISLAREIRLIQQLRSGKYDLSISFDCKDRLALMTFLAAIPTIVGANKINHEKPKWTLASKLYTREFKIPYDLAAVHQTKVYQHLVSSFFRIEPSYFKPLSIIPTSSDKQKAISLLNSLPKTKYRVAYCIKGKDDKKTNQPGEARKKDWPASSFAELMNIVGNNFDAMQFVVGVKSDHHYIEQVCEEANVPVYNMAGTTSLPELAAILQSIDLLITVDTGIMHLAAGLDVPTVAIFKQSLPVKWAPCNPRATVVYQVGLVKDLPDDLECTMTASQDLSVKDVADVVIRRLF